MTKLPDIVALDFETHAAAPHRPDYPPEPVGLALKHRGRPASYESFGHPTGNTSSREGVLCILRDIWESGVHVVFHNAKFDLAVAYERMGLPKLPWERVHDTTFLAYLADPHARSIALKDICADWLDWPAEEQDAIAEWVWDNRKQLVESYGGKITRAKSGPNAPGAWIARCPADLVEPYAIGDVERTLALFDHLYPIIQREGMGRAYDRERRLLPILMENEEQGLCVDTAALEVDIAYYGDVLKYVEGWLRKRLDAPGLNFDADRDVAEAFDRAGIVDPDDWVLTGKSKQRSVSKDNLPPWKYQDEKVAQAFGYRNRLVTCLKMFMQPWAEQASARGGVISTTWNQTRGAEAGGTRTGRPSTSRPNFLNLSKDFENRSDGYKHPEFLGVEPLPLVRSYILPDEGHVFLHRDFSGQEVRVFAHYEQGDLLEAYRADPALDPHGWLRDMILDVVGKELERTRVKNVTFSRLYGGGAGAVYAQARCSSMAEARELIGAHDKALPGRRILVDEITRLVRRGEPIVTWGGRKYFPEPPKRVDGKVRSFEYKLINYLIQGSAADVTKEVICRWYDHPDRDARFLVTVYDEINVSAPREIAEQQMRVLRECMEDIELDAPMLTEGKMGRSWGELEECE